MDAELKQNEEGKMYKYEENGMYYGGDYPEKEGDVDETTNVLMMDEEEKPVDEEVM